LTDVQGVADRLAIIGAIQAYGMAVDEQRWDVLGELLTDNNRFRGAVAGQGPLDSLDSRDELIQWLRDYTDTLEEQLRHNFTSIVVTEQSEDAATAIAYLLLASATAGGARVAATGFYRIELVLEGGAWRIASFYAGFDAPPF
jgi:hypothetical protein